MMRNRKGFSFTELLVVMAFMALLYAIAAPKIGRMKTGASLRSAKDQLASSIATARAAAVQKGRQSRFLVQGNSIRVEVDTSAVGNMAVIKLIQLDSLYRATVTVRNPVDTILAYDPRGYGRTRSAGTAIYVMTVGDYSDSVCVTQLGALMKRGCNP
jgi:prepilin-type N-terminal cleavage/methylation domain-containing protein